MHSISAAAKTTRLRSISDERGVISAVAMDQRRSLRRMIASASCVADESISDAQLAEFKSAVAEGLTPGASAILLDPEYGLEASQKRSPTCGLLMTYESDGYENPRPHRMLELMPRYSVRRLAELGAGAIKILLSYNPEADETANDTKRAWIERIGNECAGLDMPFLLEPVLYDAPPEKKPELVVRTMREFSRPIYRVDVLKVEFPVVAGTGDWTRAETLDWYRRADEATHLPYIYLSAGINIAQFLGSLDLAAQAGAHFSGVLCGRATWQDGIPALVRGGLRAFEEWLAVEGVRNLKNIREALAAATGWEHRG